MLLDGKDVIIVISKDLVSQAVERTNDLIQRAISKCNYKRFSTPCYFQCFSMRMMSLFCYYRRPCVLSCHTYHQLFNHSVHQFVRTTPPGIVLSHSRNRRNKQESSFEIAPGNQSVSQSIEDKSFGLLYVRRVLFFWLHPYQITRGK
jgi:hypothetical protein